MKRKITFEIEDTKLFDAIRAVNGDASSIGAQVVGTMMTGTCSFGDRLGMAAYGIEHVIEPEPQNGTEVSTPAARWRVEGQPDPHGSIYDCERAKLLFGDQTDDELANAVFLHDHLRFDLAALQRGEPSSFDLLTAAKERIRWLSRKLVEAEAALRVERVDAPAILEEGLHNTTLRTGSGGSCLELWWRGAGQQDKPAATMRYLQSLVAESPELQPVWKQSFQTAERPET